jgi:Family of unknown function (DUF6209)
VKLALFAVFPFGRRITDAPRRNAALRFECARLRILGESMQRSGKRRFSMTKVKRPDQANTATSTTWPRSGSVQPSEIVNDPALNVPTRREEPAARFDGMTTSADASFAHGSVPRATLTFDGAWGESQSAPLVAGGQLVVSFDPARVQIQHTHNGFPAWGVNAFIRMHPSGEVIERPAVQFESIMGRPTNRAQPSNTVVDIPLGTTSVEIWFRNWTGADHPDERWDSDWGKNYTFPVT